MDGQKAAGGYGCTGVTVRGSYVPARSCSPGAWGPWFRGQGSGLERKRIFGLWSAFSLTTKKAMYAEVSVSVVSGVVVGK